MSKRYSGQVLHWWFLTDTEHVVLYTGRNSQFPEESSFGFHCWTHQVSAWPSNPRRFHLRPPPGNTVTLTESPAGGVQTGGGPKESQSPGPLWDSVLHWLRLKPGPTPTHRGRGSLSLAFSKNKKQRERKEIENIEEKEIPDLGHVSAADCEGRRCVFLARLLDVVHVQTDGQDKAKAK